MVLVRKDAWVDLLPDLKEPLLTTTSPEIHQRCKTSRAMVNKDISEKVCMMIRDVKRWWWVGGGLVVDEECGKGKFKNAVGFCL